MVTTFQPWPKLDWTNSNLKLLPENFQLFDVLRAPLHLKIHHSAPCGICFMWKQSNQRERNVVWAYFLEPCRQGSAFSCKCNWHDLAFISFIHSSAHTGSTKNWLLQWDRASSVWRVLRRARYQNPSDRKDSLNRQETPLSRSFPVHFKKNEALISNNEALCLKCSSFYSVWPN